MEAVAGIGSRILEIQSRIAQLAPPPRMVATPLSLSGPTAGGTTTNGVTPRGTTTGGITGSGFTTGGMSGGSSAMAFGAILDEAISAAAPASTAPASPVAAPPPAAPVFSPGSGLDLLDASGVPRGLLRYGNGKVPTDALGGIAGTNHRLWTPAARSLEALRAAAARDGVTIGITDSYRTYESQVSLAERKGLYSQGGLAAKPGTSDHGWGIATDLRLDGKAQTWMRANAGAYGFVEDTPREPWHWGYHPTH